jgi:hypothetical protein
MLAKFTAMVPREEEEPLARQTLRLPVAPEAELEREQDEPAHTARMALKAMMIGSFFLFII